MSVVYVVQRVSFLPERKREKEMSVVSCMMMRRPRSRSTTLMRFSATRVGPASSMTLTRLSVHA